MCAAPLAVLLPAWPLAQVSPGGDFTDLVTVATQIGLSAVFLWQWRDERRERRDLQGTVNTLTDKFGGVLRDVIETLDRVQAGMAAQVQRAADTPDRRDLDLSIRRLELLVDEMAHRRRREDP